MAGETGGSPGRALLDHVPVMVTISDREGRIVYANPATGHISGFAPEEFVALDPFERMHHEDRPRCEEAFEELLSTPGLSVDMEHLLPGARPRVFAFFADPAGLAKWWGPHGFSTPSVEMDLRPGGTYRFAMQPPDGDVFHLSGEFRTIEPPARLVYTFRWEEPDPDDRETVVDLAFGDLDDSTEVALVQSGFATEGRRALHEAGWTDGLDRLQELMSSRG